MASHGAAKTATLAVRPSHGASERAWHSPTVSSPLRRCRMKSSTRPASRMYSASPGAPCSKIVSPRPNDSIRSSAASRASCQLG